MSLRDPLRLRFERKYAVTPSGCWEWTAALTADGYGRIRSGGRPAKAHRVAWELYRGSVPEGMFVCHRCDNPSCVNPDHLFLGTPADNMRDMIAKGRAHHGERHPSHKLTDEQVEQIRSLAGTMSQRAIARMFGVKQPAICRILSGKRRAALTAPDPDLAAYHQRYRQKEAA